MLAKNLLTVVALTLATAATANPVEKRWEQACCCPESSSGIVGAACQALVVSFSLQIVSLDFAQLNHCL